MKKKIQLLIALISLGFIMNSCTKLDILPLNIISSETAFDDESTVQAYVQSMYNQMPIEDAAFFAMFRPFQVNTDEALNVSYRQLPSIGDGTMTQWWGYTQVRNVNDFIKRIPDGAINSTLKTTLLGEAMFIRAYDYFAMVKRYGGVPIIKTPQNWTGNNLEELQVPRNTEKEVYDFIISDLDSAALLLPETNVKGAVTKFSALTLKSRVMLYAATIAKYGTVGLNGLNGIPASYANGYFQGAMDAANLVIQSGKYILYNSVPDKTENFRSMFLLQTNPEAIFTKFFSFPDKVHSFDCYFLPFALAGPSGFSSECGPTLDLVEQFEYIDGTSGPLPMGTPSAPIYYANPLDIYQNRDPRLLATVIVPFSQWRGTVVEVQAGIYDLGVKTEALAYTALYNPVTHKIDNTNGTLHVTGSSGFSSGETTATGFYIRKYLDSGLAQNLAKNGGSSQPWIDMRYAEVLLNYAEAAIELGNVPEAKAKVNLVRARAGIALLDDASTTRDRIRHERLVEFAFENHRWWDYRRWRIADQVFNNLRVRDIRPYWDIQANAYRFESQPTGVYTKHFEPKVYFERIAPAELTKNPKLVQNLGY